MVENKLFPFMATWEVLAPLTNDPIMSGRLIWSFRHFEHNSPSIISERAERTGGAQCHYLIPYKFCSPAVLTSST